MPALGSPCRCTRSLRLGRWLTPLVGLALLSAATVVAAQPHRTVEAEHGLVVSVSAPSSAVGLEILKQGGNAVDAAVATAFALAVTHPEAGNIGGGGFMMVHPGPGRQPVCIEYRETAPASANPTMFAPDESRLGHKIVGVPGTVRGLGLAHHYFGSLPWKRLVLPAVKLADDGFAIDASLTRSLNGVLKTSGGFSELVRIFGPPDAMEWKEGDRLVQKELAATLRLIAESGPDAFYQGPIADRIVAEMQAGGGLTTHSDLAGYQAKVREPIHGTFRGYDVYGPPPPSSGGICLVEMLNILETFDLRRHGRWSPQAVHLMIEAMRRAYSDRARFIGDPDFTTVPAHLTSKEYARELAQQIDPKHATPSAALAGDIALADEGPSTTHFSIIDQQGMAVSNTYTLEQSYGSRVVVRGAGFLLNNEMGDFNWRPGHTDRQGAIGTPANIIAPGKRMLSSQTPVILVRDGRVAAVTGSPGGRTIINTVLCVVLNLVEFEMPPRAAVAAPRLHHAWFPDRVQFEALGEGEYEALTGRLRELGHTLVDSPLRQGDAHTIWVDPQTGRYFGAADHRRSGSAAGY